MSQPTRAAAEPKRSPPSHGSPPSTAVDRQAEPALALLPGPALLTDPRLSSAASQAQRVRLLQRLQHGYGNGHVARVLQRVADCPAPPVDKPKLEPADDPKFKQVQGNVKQVATREKEHPPAKTHANQAEAAAQPPGNDVASQAAAKQVDTMAGQQPGAFDKKAFIAAVTKAIEAASPKNLEEADDFKKSGKAAKVKDEVSGIVSKGKDDSQKAIKDKTQAAPDASDARPKPVTPMPEARTGAPPSDVGAGRALPDAKTAEDTSLAAGPCEVNGQLADAGVTEEQLKKSNEPQFNDALDQKKKAEVHAAEAPKEFKTEEKQVLGQAAGDAKADASKHLDAMHQSKTGAHGKVGGKKDDTKAHDEAKRAEIAAKLESIYTTAKTDVTAILDGLDGKVSTAFEAGEKTARESFENYVQKRMDDYKDKRYSGLEGAALWIKDKVMGMPAEVSAFYAEGRALYLKQMDAVIDKVADIVGGELTRAKQRLAQGRQEILKETAGLKGHLKDLLQDTIQKINGNFEQLEGDINSKQDSLVQDLAQKYVAAREAVDARINEMKASDKGLVDAAKDAVNSVIDTIKNLKNMLLGVLAKASAVIDTIVADPIKFLGNLVNAIKQGLNQFVGNIATHLKKGLMGWLFGALGDAGITLPESFDLKGIISLILQVLGLTYDNIRGIAVKIAGEKVVGAVEKTVKFFVTLATEGPAGLWNFIKEKIAEINIKEMVLGAIKDFVITKIITAGVTWLIGLLNPAAAFIKACKMIYDVIMFFIERGAQIMEFVNSVLDGIGAIAAGNIGSAANLVESSLARILPLAISFLASLLGVGGIAEKIKEIIEKIRAPITKLVTAVLGPILKPLKKLYDRGAKFVKGLVDKGKALGKKALNKVKDKAKGLLGGGKKADERAPAQKQADLSTALDKADKFAQDPALSVADIKKKLPAIKAQFKMTSLNLVVHGAGAGKESVQVVGSINPTGDRPAHTREATTFDKAKAEHEVVEHVEEPTQWEAMLQKQAAGSSASEEQRKTRVSPSSASFSEKVLYHYLDKCRGLADSGLVNSAHAAVMAGMDQIRASTSSDDIYARFTGIQSGVNTALREAGFKVTVKGKKAKNKSRPLTLNVHHSQEQSKNYSTNPKTYEGRVTISKKERESIAEWATSVADRYKGHITAQEREQMIRDETSKLVALVKQRILEQKLEKSGQHIGDDSLDEIDMEVLPQRVHQTTHRKRTDDDKSSYTPENGQQ